MCTELVCCRSDFEIGMMSSLGVSGFVVSGGAGGSDHAVFAGGAGISGISGVPGASGSPSRTGLG